MNSNQAHSRRSRAIAAAVLTFVSVCFITGAASPAKQLGRNAHTHGNVLPPHSARPAHCAPGSEWVADVTHWTIAIATRLAA